MNSSRGIFQDWKVNKPSMKGRIIMVLFRSASSIWNNKLLLILFFPYLIFYRIFIEWIMGIEIPWKTIIGPNLLLFHGQGLVINPEAIIGANCKLRHLTTIGNKKLSDGSYSGSPTIGDYVDIGAHVVIIGPVKIGSNVLIGAGSIITKDVPSNCVIAGNPAKVLKSLNLL